VQASKGSAADLFRAFGQGAPMIDTHVDRLGFLARLVLTLALLLFFAGVAWHGVTLETFQRIWIDLIERPDGPMSFRFILQPLMAVIAATLDGRRDARRSRSPYFLTVLRNREERIGRLREGLNATARIILLGIMMDVIYQLIVLKTFYPVEALIIAVVLAFVPYVLLRGISARIARRWWYRDAPRVRTDKDEECRTQTPQQAPPDSR
jgi:hypothetical protein